MHLLLKYIMIGIQVAKSQYIGYLYPLDCHCSLKSLFIMICLQCTYLARVTTLLSLSNPSALCLFCNILCTHLTILQTRNRSCMILILQNKKFNQYYLLRVCHCIGLFFVVFVVCYVVFVTCLLKN